jgi:hypothetical protein
LVGRCEHGHEYARELLCRRDWCPICGKEDSNAHQGRKARWFSRVVQAASFAYIVLTIPPEVRGSYRTRESLGDLGTAAKRMFQRQGFDRGLRRWHWFGDRSKVYHPHLNCLLPSGWLSKEQIKRLKASWGRILGVDVSRVNLKVRICDTPRKILHRVKYITRATFTDWRWDEELARELVGFRNSGTWGTWDGAPAWEVEAEEGEYSGGYKVAMLERGLCPEDQTVITWGGLIRGRPLGRYLGGGYWMSGGRQ